MRRARLLRALSKPHCSRSGSALALASFAQHHHCCAATQRPAAAPTHATACRRCARALAGSLPACGPWQLPPQRLPAASPRGGQQRGGWLWQHGRLPPPLPPPRPLRSFITLSCNLRQSRASTLSTSHHRCWNGAEEAVAQRCALFCPHARPCCMLPKAAMQYNAVCFLPLCPPAHPPFLSFSADPC